MKKNLIIGSISVALLLILSISLSLVFAQERKVVQDGDVVYTVDSDGLPQLEGCSWSGSNGNIDESVRDAIVVDGKKQHISGCKGAVTYYQTHVDEYKLYLNTKTQDYLQKKYNDIYVDQTKPNPFVVMTYDDYSKHADEDGIIYENDFFTRKKDGTIEKVFTIPAYVDMDTLREIYNNNKSFFTDEDYDFDDLFVM